MSWHARRLVDLVDGLARRINKRRYDALARHLGRSPGVEDGGQQGFVIVQIDGLGYDYLIEAIARGYVPRLRRLLSRGGSRPGMELYRELRGRDPEIGPLLERRGLTADS